MIHFIITNLHDTKHEYLRVNVLDNRLECATFASILCVILSNLVIFFKRIQTHKTVTDHDIVKFNSKIRYPKKVILFVQRKSNMAEDGDYLMVAGIDFGTTFSGYGFSFKGAEEDIQLNKNWGDEQGFLVSIVHMDSS